MFAPRPRSRPCLLTSAAPPLSPPPLRCPAAPQDLQCLGRDLAQTIIVDNSPHSYIFQPENALPIGTFIDDMQDQVGGWVGGQWGRAGWVHPAIRLVWVPTHLCHAARSSFLCSLPHSVAAGSLHVTAAAHRGPSLTQELLDCLDLLLAVEKVDDVRAHLGPILARKQAGLLASFTQVRADGA